MISNCACVNDSHVCKDEISFSLHQNIIAIVVGGVVEVDVVAGITNKKKQGQKERRLSPKRDINNFDKFYCFLFLIVSPYGP